MKGQNHKVTVAEKSKTLLKSYRPRPFYSVNLAAAEFVKSPACKPEIRGSAIKLCAILGNQLELIAHRH